MLILVTLLSISAMMAGMFLSGIWAPASQSRHQLQLFPFIAATSMAPIGIPLAVYWVLRIVEAIRNRGDDA